MSPLRAERLLPLLLAATTFLVYSQLGEHDFINLDDPQYVLENPPVQAGLSAEGVLWALTSTTAHNWHPLTWLSHMLDCELHGLNPTGHHLTSLLFHIANTLLLFAALRRMTGALWRSALVAALFALHPLHVESVAWVAERKDVLSGFFWMLTLWAYARYAERPGSKRRYLVVALCLSLGLMAKATLVTLPFVLLLLDFWPLGRFRSDGSEEQLDRSRCWPLLREKLPLLVLALAASVVTLVVQAQSGAVRDLEALPLDVRIGNAFVAYVAYLVKTVWPVGLSIFYPHPGTEISLTRAFSAAVFLSGISVLVLRAARSRPYLPVGWFWYLGTLVPVIGLVQVGQQAMADRYTYLPLIGIFLMLAWGAPELWQRYRLRSAWLATASTLLLGALAVCSWVQVGHWRNSVTLFEHATRVTSDNALAHLNLAKLLVWEGRDESALRNFNEAIRIDPAGVTAHYHLASLLARQGRAEEARRHYAMALWNTAEIDSGAGHSELRSDRPGREPALAQYTAGISLARDGRLDQAILRFRKALELDPELIDARLDLATSLLVQGERVEAHRELAEVLRVRSDYARAHYRLALALMMEHRVSEAIPHLASVLDAHPEHRAARKLMRAIEDQRTRSDS